VNISEDDYLAHYGILRKSGRYPWGSGGEHSSPGTFLGSVEGMRKQGLSETEIARGFGMTTTQLRAVKSIARAEQKQAQIGQAQRLKDKGYSNIAIGKRMGLNESSVRALLAPGEKDKADVLETTASMLKSQVDEKGLLDIGVGVEHHIGVSKDKLNTAVAILREKGYGVHYVKVEQLGTGKQTTIKVLSKPDVTYKQVFENRSKIRQISEFSQDGGRSFLGLLPPISVNSKRIAVRYAEDGGADADGVIYVRPGVKDLSLGESRYAQVRIAVDGTHYLKGMAMYKDDLPAGVDLVFNTNKKNTGNKKDAMKDMKSDPDNPFGSVVRQIIKKGSDGKDRVTSAMNIVNEEGNWEGWSRSLSSQMLSKQSPKLAGHQLDMTFEKKRNALEEISTLTNPAVRKKLLEAYADDADSSAVHLKAAALPRQGSHVILPINSMKEGEIYAPNYRNGEKVALVRYPHGGIFEIPELTVNNRHPQARKLLGNAKDAVGINSKVAERLSGADFDGDTVLVIPNADRKVKTASALEGLKGFDPVRSYKVPEGSGIPRMTARTKGIEMGVVSNLITDMTIRGANTSELARAVRHSMVVIDAEKHHLNYKQSAIDNGISQLKTKYQGSARAGASTLISRASAEIRVPDRRPRPAAKGGPVDRATGKKVFEPTGVTYTDRKGKVVPKTIKSKRLAETDNADTLSSGTPIEKVYAIHSNRLKDLANQARKAAVSTRSTPYSPSAKTAYSKEVATLNAKLNLALKNAPLERQAQVVANAVVSQKRAANPEMDGAEIKKLKAQALAEARTRTGAQKQRITLTDSEWGAIQAGAISNNKLTQILDHADLDQIKQLATPKSSLLMTSAKQTRARSMLASGYTQAEVADALGVSLTTLKNSIV
jgi:DNA-binding CsgD family transcriptional regulator/transcriptional regulator